MAGNAGRRKSWLAGAVFVALVGTWYVANLLAAAASLRSLRAADARIVASGHQPVFGDLPWVWDWEHNLRPVLFGILGAAVIAVLLRRAFSRPWFLLAGALPVVIGHGERVHGWWVAGMGIDQWTFGAGVAIPDLDLTRFGAGPSWTLAAGTLLVVAAVVAPAMCLSEAPARMQVNRRVLNALPYVGLLAVATALAVGKLRIDNSGDGSSREMFIGAAAAAAIATLVVLVAPDRRSWPTVSVAAVAVGLVTVSGLHADAMLSTKMAAFGAAAGIAVVAGFAARRAQATPRSLRAVTPANELLTDPAVSRT